MAKLYFRYGAMNSGKSTALLQAAVTTNTVVAAALGATALAAHQVIGGLWVLLAFALDAVAIACSPHRDISINPAKMLAIGLADAVPDDRTAGLLGAATVELLRALIASAADVRHERDGDATAFEGGADHGMAPLWPGLDRGLARWQDPEVDRLLEAARR